MKTRFAIGCLIQWYEIELVEEYLQSVKNAVDMIDNKKDVIIDLYFNTDETLEKLDEDKISMSSIRDKFNKILFNILGAIVTRFNTCRKSGHYANKPPLRFCLINSDCIAIAICCPSSFP